MSDINDKLREARNAGIAGWTIFLIILGAAILSGRCGPPDTPAPSPTPTVEVTR